MCCCLGKACPAPGRGTPKILISILPTNPTYICRFRSLLMVSCCYLTSHKQCKHQDFQRLGSPQIHAECGIQRGFRNVVCSCNFVICTVKYTHTCALGTGFKLVYLLMVEGSLFVCLFVLFVLMRSTKGGCSRSCSWSLWKALEEEGCMGLVSWRLELPWRVLEY